ncbi:MULTISPECIES: hypothetical protein [unclassified Paenibacillus]
MKLPIPIVRATKNRSPVDDQSVQSCTLTIQLETVICRYSNFADNPSLATAISGISDPFIDYHNDVEVALKQTDYQVGPNLYKIFNVV